MEEKEEEEKKGISLPLKIIIFFCLILIAFSIYIFVIEPRQFRIEETEIIKTDLPESFNGFKIVVFGDIHYGTFIHAKDLKNIVNKINQAKPDLVIFTGDLLDSSINYTEEEYQELIDIFKSINATQKKYAVYGDADLSFKNDYFKIIDGSGFHLLEDNNNLFYYKNDSPILIAGIAPGGDIKKALSTDEEIALKILISHYPNVINDISEQKVEMIFAGHSLGGLINIPFYGPLFDKDNVEHYTKGLYTKEGISLYVTNGIGLEKYKMRFNNIPSANLYRLYNYQ